MKKSYVFLADGFEEIEAITPVDVMRRAGMEVITVSINSDVKVTGANGMSVNADTTINALGDIDAEWLVCPGGMPGASNLAANATVCSLLTDQFRRGGKIAAICAAPAVVLSPLSILEGREATCYPGFEQMCPQAEMKNRPVVALDTLITGNGPGAALPFAYAIVANSLGAEKAAEIAGAMMYTGALTR